MIKTTPMIFNSEMVRALLAGNKTQTRRIIKSQSICEKYSNAENYISSMCPFGKSGDLIYVRETFGFSDPDYYDYETPMDVIYRTELNRPVTRMPEKWKPSIHMPRWASRLTLKINSVRVERIQDISEKDSWAEGFEGYDDDVTGGVNGYSQFCEAWKNIYGASWDKNEWVWVIDFEVIHKNIDLVLAEMEQINESTN
mgnify:CR=1 FL=1|tara:strand:+ start:345 stop:938 length:594 start_codon:yes stop_codon:yes gene_type:complete